MDVNRQPISLLNHLEYLVANASYPESPCRLKVIEKPESDFDVWKGRQNKQNSTAATGEHIP